MVTLQIWSALTTTGEASRSGMHPKKSPVVELVFTVCMRGKA
jgi:hypothetical protein